MKPAVQFWASIIVSMCDSASEKSERTQRYCIKLARTLVELASSNDGESVDPHEVLGKIVQEGIGERQDQEFGSVYLAAHEKYLAETKELASQVSVIIDKEGGLWRVLSCLSDQERESFEKLLSELENKTDLSDQSS